MLRFFLCFSLEANTGTPAALANVEYMSAMDETASITRDPPSCFFSPAADEEGKASSSHQTGNPKAALEQRELPPA